MMKIMKQFLSCKGSKSSPFSFELAYVGRIGQNLDLSSLSRKFYNYLYILCGHLFSHNGLLSGSTRDVLSRILHKTSHMGFFCSIQPIWHFLAQSRNPFFQLLILFPYMRFPRSICLPNLCSAVANKMGSYGYFLSSIRKSNRATEKTILQLLQRIKF